MTVDHFIDTGIFIHAIDTTAAQSARRDRARELIRADRFGTSTQVIQEFYHTATRQIATPLPATLAARWVDRLLRMPFVQTDAVLIKTAIIRSHAYRISPWDAAILSAAEALGAKTLYTGNLEHGRTYGSVTAINPFK